MPLLPKDTQSYFAAFKSLYSPFDIMMHRQIHPTKARLNKELRHPRKLRISSLLLAGGDTQRILRMVNSDFHQRTHNIQDDTRTVRGWLQHASATKRECSMDENTPLLPQLHHLSGIMHNEVGDRGFLQSGAKCESHATTHTITWTLEWPLGVLCVTACVVVSVQYKNKIISKFEIFQC